jgi:hypothetical protein
LADEFEDVFDFCFPAVFLWKGSIKGTGMEGGGSHHMLAVLVSPTELNRSRDEGWERESHAFTSSFEMSSSRLEELAFKKHVRHRQAQPCSRTYLKLHIKRLSPEQMNHSRHPTLFLCQLIPLQMIWPLSPRILNTRLMSHTPVRLIFNQDMTQFQDTVDVFWGFDYSFIF